MDITSALIQLPENLTNAGCHTEEEARFVISGKGGIPANPRQTLQSEVILQDLRTFLSSSLLLPPLP